MAATGRDRLFPTSDKRGNSLLMESSLVGHLYGGADTGLKPFCPEGGQEDRGINGGDPRSGEDAAYAAKAS